MPSPTLTQEQRKQSVAKATATRKANIAARNKRREDALTYRNGLKEEIEALEHKLSQMRYLDKINDLAAPLTGHSLLREEEIVAHSLPWQRSTGVYFLIHQRKVVYVGQSVCILSRIQTHSVDPGKVFDHYTYVECSAEKLDILESLYIHLLRPPLNGDSRNGGKTAPVALSDIIN